MENNFKYKRIIVLGGSGSGKSSLAERISNFTGYPLYHLDEIFHDSNWNKIDKDRWPEICKKEILIKDIAVVDGNYTNFLEDRVNWADLIIFIKLPTLILLYRNLKRFISIELDLEKRKGAVVGHKNIFTKRHFLWVLNWNRNIRKKIFLILNSAKSKKVLIIKKPNKLNLEELLR
jgi:adenylate kinase family enzyme